MSTNVVHHKRVFYKAQTGLAINAIADLEAAYFEGLTLGTVPVGPLATTTTAGSVKKATAVPDQTALTVTDIATAQTAVNALVAKINALLAASRTAGQLS